MKRGELERLLGFYQNQLKNEILAFWLPRCVDHEYGGFLNCFDNSGRHLISTDKYTWSQGRFVWVFAKLAGMRHPMFNAEEKASFLAQARQGADFLLRHALVEEGDWRCVFLMDRSGRPKLAAGVDVVDSSIFADCFVTAGLAQFSARANSKKHWDFAKNLYASIMERLRSGRYHSLPYPLSPSYRMHSIPMIATNLACEMAAAAGVMEAHLIENYMEDVNAASADVLENFVDKNGVLREIISSDNRFVPGILGSHMNPGHALEDMWFQLQAMELLGLPERLPRIARVAKTSFSLGWDEPWGGLLHFCTLEGGEIHCSPEEMNADEPQLRQVCGDWSSKLWWVHSEALYTALLLYFKTGDEEFLRHYYRTEEYVFKTFPNRDPEIREWEQIRTREGKAQDKVVALPVKDPYHITRNMILIIELLEAVLAENTFPLEP